MNLVVLYLDKNTRNLTATCRLCGGTYGPVKVEGRVEDIEIEVAHEPACPMLRLGVLPEH